MVLEVRFDGEVAAAFLPKGWRPMSEREKLLPCPFCGQDTTQLAAAVITDENELVMAPFVSCLECGAIGPQHDGPDEEQAARLWNMRIGSTP